MFHLGHVQFDVVAAEGAVYGAACPQLAETEANDRSTLLHFMGTEFKDLIRLAIQFDVHALSHIADADNHPWPPLKWASSGSKA